MRNFAELIIHEASELYPDGPHSAVFKQEFGRFGIVEEEIGKNSNQPDHAPDATAAGKQ